MTGYLAEKSFEKEKICIQIDKTYTEDLVYSLETVFRQISLVFVVVFNYREMASLFCCFNRDDGSSLVTNFCIHLTQPQSVLHGSAFSGHLAPLVLTVPCLSLLWSCLLLLSSIHNLHSTTPKWLL